LGALVMAGAGSGAASSTTAFFLPPRLGGALSVDVAGAGSGAFFAPRRVATMLLY
jgi:hypothetical protein